MPKKQSVYKQTLRQYWDISMRHRSFATLALLTPIGSLASGVGVPFFAGKCLAGIALQDGTFQSNLLWLCVVVVVAVVCNRIGFVSTMRLQAVAMSDLAENVFERLLYRGIRFHNNTVGGKLVSDTQDYLMGYMHLTAAFYTTGSAFALTLAGGLLIIYLQSWQLGLLISIVMGFLIWWTYVDSMRRSHLRSIRHAATKVMVSHNSDTVVNIQTVKVFASEQSELDHHKELNKNLTQLRLRDWEVAGKNGNNRIAILMLAIIGLLILLNYLFTQNSQAIGVGIFAFTYVFVLILRLFEINALTRTVEEAFLSARPTTLMLEEELEIKDSPHATALHVTKGEIDFKNVSFRYEEATKDHYVFHDLTTTIRSGEKVGIVGPSGGGKTTLTKLLLRFEDIQEGSIAIEGQSITDVTQTSLRQHIGYVPQEPLLFHRTIKENIAYGKPGASDKEIEDAAKKARAFEFIQDLPQGFDTIVGERGVKLSGGQRQRIAIARVMLKDAPILLLDEATSALDSESEQLVQLSLWELMKGRTTLVIAHRLSTIQKMDRILVLDNGKIVEEGKHAELIQRKDGLYARLWAHQSGGFLA